jgi:histidinol-phosphate aminotransferase
MIDACEQSPSYIRAIAPYQPGKPISELAREMGIDEASIIKLASNENPLGTSPSALRAIERQLVGLSRYPDGSAFDLKKPCPRITNSPKSRSSWVTVRMTCWK